MGCGTSQPAGALTTNTSGHPSQFPATNHPNQVQNENLEAVAAPPPRESSKEVLDAALLQVLLDRIKARGSLAPALGPPDVPTLADSCIGLSDLAEGVRDLHDGMPPAVQRPRLRLLKISAVLSWSRLIVYEAVDAECDCLEVPYCTTGDELWKRVATLSWRWSAQKPVRRLDSFSPMSDAQFSELKALLGVAADHGLEYVWIDWSCVPQYSASPMLEVHRSKVFYARARAMLVLPTFGPLPEEGPVRLILGRARRVLIRQAEEAAAAAGAAGGAADAASKGGPGDEPVSENGDTSPPPCTRASRAAIASEILTAILEKNLVAGREYFGRVWTLAERMARHGRSESLCHWLSLEAWLGMLVDAMLKSTEDQTSSRIYKKMLGHAAALLDAVLEPLAAAVRTSSVQIPAADGLDVRVAELCKAAVGVWLSPCPLREAPDRQWLDTYLGEEATSGVYQAWDEADRVWAVYSYFCWRTNLDHGSAAGLHTALEDLVAVAAGDRRAYLMGMFAKLGLSDSLEEEDPSRVNLIADAGQWQAQTQQATATPGAAAAVIPQPHQQHREQQVGAANRGAAYVTTTPITTIPAPPVATSTIIPAGVRSQSSGSLPGNQVEPGLTPGALAAAYEARKGHKQPAFRGVTGNGQPQPPQTPPPPHSSSYSEGNPPQVSAAAAVGPRASAAGASCAGAGAGTGAAGAVTGGVGHAVRDGVKERGLAWQPHPSPQPPVQPALPLSYQPVEAVAVVTAAGREPVSAAEQQRLELQLKMREEEEALAEAEERRRQELAEAVARRATAAAMRRDTAARKARTEEEEQLLTASRCGKVATLKAILQDVDVNPNATAKDGSSALHLAALSGYREVVATLLAAGADMAAKDLEGRTPLHSAATNGHLDVVAELLAAGASVGARDSDGNTPLLFASQNGHKAVVEALIAAGADVRATSKDSCTPLHYAARNGRHEVVATLLAAGADVRAQGGQSSCTPLHFASQHGHREVVQALLAAGADVKAADKDGGTALLLASQYGSKDVVQTLLAAGADVARKNKAGRTALDLANESGRKDVVQLLHSWQPATGSHAGAKRR